MSEAVLLVGGDPERLGVLLRDEREIARAVARDAVGAGQPRDGLVAVAVVDQDGVVGFDDGRHPAAVLLAVSCLGDNGTVAREHADRVVDHGRSGPGFVLKPAAPWLVSKARIGTSLTRFRARSRSRLRLTAALVALRSVSSFVRLAGRAVVVDDRSGDRRGLRATEFAGAVPEHPDRLDVDAAIG